MSRSREGLTLVNDETKPQFTNELRAWIQLWRHHEGIFTINQQELAERMHINKQALNDWVQGRTIPNSESCRLIAQFFGLDEDLVLFTAGRPTFPVVLSAIETLRHGWREGGFIYSALKLTQERRWRFSHSPWKERAEFELDRGWKKGMNERQIHDLALTLAILIERWATDPQREVPLYQRQVAMSA